MAKMKTMSISSGTGRMGYGYMDKSTEFPAMKMPKIQMAKSPVMSNVRLAKVKFSMGKQAKTKPITI